MQSDAKRSTITPDLFWIPGAWRGRLAIAARPRGGEWLENEAAGWRAAGVDVLVSLLEDGESKELGLADERRAVNRAGLEFRSFAIPDRGLPGSTEETISLLAAIAANLERGKNVAVHCRQGVGRSGLIAQES
jgi:predicted protein tyrosine phosphatase